MIDVTHWDVIEFIEKYYTDEFYEVLNGNLLIKGWVIFSDFDFSTLPERMIFDTVCDLRDSCIETLPEDIVVQGNLLLNTSKIHSLPSIHINKNLNINFTDIVLEDGIYIGGSLWSLYTDSYKHLCYLHIGGYYFSTGVLS